MGNIKSKLVQDITWKELVRANGDTLSFPFQLTFQDPNKPLICEKVLRIVPQKRLVVEGVWEGQPVVAKLFYSSDAKRHCMRDIEGITILDEGSVPTPQLLFQGCTHKRRTQVILFEKIEEAVSLDRIWQEKEVYVEIVSLMRSFMIELATQHVLGILQQDLHLKNFLVTDNQIYTLDGGAITQLDMPLDKKNSLENLGLFFSQLGVGTEDLQRELFQVYVKSRGWLVSKADLDLLKISIIAASEERWKNYHKKIFRSCTAFKKLNKLFKTIMYDRNYQAPVFLSVLQFPDAIFNDPNTVILKNGRSSTVAKFVLNDRILVIKRYNIKNGFHRLRRLLRDTRAKESWRLAQRLLLFGIATAKPIAYIENRFLGLRGKSYLIMEYLAGVDSGTFFEKYQPDDPLFEKVAKRVLMLIQDLRQLKLVHADLKKTNIIIQREQPFLIDLDGMKEYTLTIRLKRAYKKEMKRFMHNWSNAPSVVALFKRLMTLMAVPRRPWI